MPYRIMITGNARKDLRDAIDWENHRQTGLAERMLAMVHERIAQISDTPGMGSVRYKNIRCTAAKTFSYLIHYTVDDSLQTIVILRILHTSRKPIW
jgi:plasmid stabilization system protein ParE